MRKSCGDINWSPCFPLSEAFFLNSTYTKATDETQKKKVCFKSQQALIYHTFIYLFSKVNSQPFWDVIWLTKCQNLKLAHRLYITLLYTGGICSICGVCTISYCIHNILVGCFGVGLEKRCILKKNLKG